MKPIKLTMTAFGPYAKEQVIDFNELKDSRLFLITGPTGAGKTTIFDAISYALYGESSGDLRTAEGLRSHFAEPEIITKVTLEFALRGKRYYIERIPKQLKKKLRGEGYTEQQPTVELLIYDNIQESTKPSKVITRGKEVDKYIETIIGLNSEQFKQIMMLPQGEFRKLLTASSQEREQVMKQLFDTQIYGIIQKKLDEENKECQRKLNELKLKKQAIIEKVKESDDEEHLLNQSIRCEYINIDNVLEGIKLLSIEDENKASEIHNQITIKEKALKETIEKKTNAQQINELINKREEIIIQLEKLMLEEGKHKEEQIEIDLANKALKIQPIQSRMIERQKEYEEKNKQYNTVIKQLNEAKIQQEKSEKLLQDETTPEKQANREELNKERIQLNNLIEKVERLTIINNQYAEVEKKNNVIKNKLSENKQLLNDTIEITEVKQNKKEELSQVEVEIGRVHFKLTEKQQVIKNLEDIKASIITLDKLKKDINTQKNKLDKKEEEYNISETNYKQLQIDYHLNQAALLAKDLEIGQPCPVCGSVEHPMLAQSITRIVKNEELEEAEKVRNNNQNNYLKELEKFNDLNQRFQLSKEQLEKKIIDIDENLQKILIDCLQTFDIAPISKNIECLEKDKEKLQKEEKKLEAAIIERQRIENEVKKLQEKKKQLESEKELILQEEKEAEKEASIMLGQIDTLAKDVPEKYRNKKILKQKIEEISKKINSEEKLIKQLQSKHEQSKQDVVKLEAMLQTIIESIKELEQLALTAKQDFEQAVKNYGFETIKHYQISLKTQQEIEQLVLIIKNYEKHILQIKQSLEDLNAQVNNHKYQELNIFDSIILEIEKELQRLQASLNTITNRNTDNNRTYEELNKIKIVSQTIEEKYAVIGSIASVANGRNAKNISFERYVLAYLLKDIIDAANLRLEKMTNGRYLLRRLESVEDYRKQSGLDLEVFDYYTGKARNVKTLSGGETFKASLSMALGLSDVVQSYSGGVQLDTMFIDEGFGTLDPESLDQAIDCLIDLQKMGRIIGIISHVPELKERVETRLEIEMSTLGSKAKFVV